MKPTIRGLWIAWLAIAGCAAVAQIPIPEPAAIAIGFHRELFPLWLVEQLATFALPLYLLYSGRAASMAAICKKFAGGRWMIGAALFAGFYALLHSAVQSPVSYLRTLRLNPYFGDAVPELFPWAVSEIVSGLQLLVVAVAIGWVPFWLIRKSPKFWWAWASGALVLITSMYLVVQPLLIDPRTKTYVPLSASEYSDWQDRVDNVVARAGVNPPVVVWKTRTDDFCRIQNSVVGLGPTRTIVLADQIFTEWEPEMVDAAVAHELKHYLFDNTWLPVFLISVFSIAGALIVLIAGRAACTRWQHRLGFSSLEEPASLPLILIVVQLYMLIAVPAFNLTAQKVEIEADRFALELTQDNDARARVSADQCGRLWLAEDTVFSRLYRNTHPSVADRVNLANTYRPWETGGQLVYGDTLNQ